MKFTLTALMFLAVWALPASAGWSSQPLTFSLAKLHISQPVDYLTWCGDCGGIDYTTGSPWVVNPSQCPWDSDDAYRYTSSGNVLDGGSVVRVSECHYAAPYSGPLLPTNVWIQSASADLVITETWSWDGGSISTQVPPPTSDHGLWAYVDCVSSPAPEVPATEVPNSHGGYAVPVRITVTVSNPTAKKATKTGGVIESGVFWNSCLGGYRALR